MTSAEEIYPILIPVLIFGGIGVAIIIFLVVVLYCRKKCKSKQVKSEAAVPLIAAPIGSVKAPTQLARPPPVEEIKPVQAAPLQQAAAPEKFNSLRRGYSRRPESRFVETEMSHLGLGDVISEDEYSLTSNGKLMKSDGTIEMVTVKSAKPGTNFEENRRVLSRELDALDAVSDDNHYVVKLVGAVTSMPDCFHIITEFCEGGTLLDFLKRQREIGIEPIDNVTQLLIDERYEPRKLTRGDLISIARKIATGLRFLHERKCLHTSLTARDILLDTDLVPKISGFGFHQTSHMSNEFIKISPHPWQWAAHEVLSELNPYFHQGADVWSFGVLLWEIFSLGEMPYEEYGENKPDDFERALRQGRNRLPMPEFATDELYAIMLSCWNSISFDRPTFTRLAHDLADMCGTECTLISIQQHNTTDASLEPNTEDASKKSLSSSSAASSAIESSPNTTTMEINETLEDGHPVA